MENFLIFSGIAYFIIGIFVYAFTDIKELMGKAADYLFLIPQNSSYVFLLTVLLWPLVLVLKAQQRP